MYNEFAKNITMESAPVRQTHYTTNKHHEGQPILLYTTADQAGLTGWRKYSIFLI